MNVLNQLSAVANYYLKMERAREGKENNEKKARQKQAELHEEPKRWRQKGHLKKSREKNSLVASQKVEQRLTA